MEAIVAVEIPIDILIMKQIKRALGHKMRIDFFENSSEFLRMKKG